MKTYFFIPDTGNVRLQVQAVDEQTAAEDAAERLARRYGRADILTGLVLIARDCDGREETWRGMERVLGPQHWINGFHVDPMAIRNLRCCCCGEGHRGRQFHNQDTGHGLCGRCADWILERGKVTP